MRNLWLVILVFVVKCSAMSKDELEDFSNFLLKTSQLDLQVKKGADPDNAFDEEEVASDHAWEDSGKFEGDLILNDRQRRLIVENVEGLSRNGLTDSTKKWPNNEVIYFIQREHFNGGQVQAIQDGIDDLARASCVKFRPYKKGDRDAVVIQGSRRGCFSQVGYQGGYQVLNLSGRHPVGRGCFRHGTVVHELLHSLGFYHMQSSPDRDDYIDVVWSNILQPARHNFQKYNSFSVSDFGVGYDYDSVLHYSRRAFSANGQDTLVPKQRGAEIGQRVGLSDKDSQKLNKMYCDANSDQVQADDSDTQKPKNKKKKPKNQPFEGVGIGYHQGKTVVIKLPTAETLKLSNVPSIDVFDFSKSPQIVSSPEAEGYQFGKGVVYPYLTPVSLYADPATENQNGFFVDKSKDVENKLEQNQVTTQANSIKKENDGPQITPNSDSDKVRPNYVPLDKYDKDLKDAFDRLSKIVKQHVYPKNHQVHRINKDYSKFYTPPKFKQTESLKDTLDEKLKKSIHYGPSTSISQNQIDNNNSKIELDEITNVKQSDSKNKYMEDRMDSSYRTLLPVKKPYSAYEQTETPPYATLDYLKDKHNYSSLYIPKSPNDHEEGPHAVFKDELPPTEEDWYKKDSLKRNPAGYDQDFFTDYIKENSGHLKDASNEYNEKYIKTHTNRNRKKYNPVEYDKDFFRNYTTEDNNVRLPENNDYYNAKNTLSAKLQEKHKTDYDQQHYTDHEKEENSDHVGESDDYYNEDIEPNEGKTTHSQPNYDKELGSDYLKEERNGRIRDALKAYDTNNKESLTRSITPEDNLGKFKTDYEKGAVSDSLRIDNLDNYDDKNGQGSPKKKKSYTMFSAPVPLTLAWYRQNYDIPDTSHEYPYAEKKTRSGENNR